MRPMRLISTTWDEGRLFDLWTLVHFLSGLAGGQSNALFRLDTPAVYALGVSMLLAWEVIEYLRGVRESWPNRVIDLLVGVAGIALALLGARFLSPPMAVLAFAVSTVLSLIGGVLGWMAYRARG